MTQSLPATTPTPEFEPSSSQLERAKAIRRFNWRFVYIPLIIGIVIVLVLLGLMLWVGLAPQQAESYRPFFSGLADIVLIFTLIPMMMLCSIGPIALIGLGAFRYQKRQEQKESGEPEPPARGLQLLLWRVDSLLDKASSSVQTHAPKAATPIIQVNAFLAYVESLIKQIRNLFMKKD